MTWTFHPVTRQRWARFRGMRRGWWAFWILLGAYGASLGLEWIANDKPLWIRFEGQNYFPIVKFYPDDVFTGSRQMTRPDYKVLAASAAFAPDSGNWMVWPLIPHGPLESLKPEDIPLPTTVTVVAVRESRVASVDVEATGRMVRRVGEADFFGLEANEPLEASWIMPETIRAGMTAR